MSDGAPRAAGCAYIRPPPDAIVISAKVTITNVATRQVVNLATNSSAAYNSGAGPGGLLGANRFPEGKICETAYKTAEAPSMRRLRRVRQIFRGFENQWVGGSLRAGNAA